MSYNLKSISTTEMRLWIDNSEIILSDLPKFESFKFDYLYYEETINSYIYFLNSKKYDMTDEQKNECLQSCKKYDEIFDYYVYAYNNQNIFTKYIKKSEAISNKYLYTTIKPLYSVSKWNTSKWEEVKLIVKEDGSIIINPSEFCDRCVLFFTENELKNNTEITKYNDKYHRWDIENNKWIIIGNEFDDLYKEIELSLREKYEKRRISLYKKYTPEYERLFWNIEITEATEYLKNNNAETPYIDGILSTLTPKIDKSEYIKRILNNNSNEFKTELGKIHGELYTQIYKLKSLKTIDELKIFKTQI